jgi:hypothetical protein
MASRIDRLVSNPTAEQMSMTLYGTPAQGCTQQQIWADVNCNREDVLDEWDMEEDKMANESHNLNPSQANQLNIGSDALTCGIK